MQRSARFRSSGPSAGSGPCLRLFSARIARRFCASGVYGGNLPSDGSTMSDVRVSEFPRSNQNALYVPGSPAGGAWSAETLASSSRSAASCGVRNCLSASALGRSKGVVVELFQFPWRSGSPHGVRGAFHLVLAGAFGCPGSACPDTRREAIHTVPIAATDLRGRWRMSGPPCVFHALAQSLANEA